LEDLIYPIKYYSFLYDEIVILTHDKDLFEKHFSYDPTIIITYQPLKLIYKKVFDLKNSEFTKKNELYDIMQINEEIIQKYFSNF
jgi:hypothetical protein